MTMPINLKELERKAFRSTHQDGLWDIYIGGIVLSMSVLAYSNGDEAFPLLRFVLYIIGMAIFYTLFMFGKKYLTTPRLGLVKFGPQRKQRKRIMVIVLGGIVLLQVGILLGTIYLLRHPEWSARMGLLHTNTNIDRLLVAVIGASFVGPSVLLIAYFNDFLRGYYIAVILSLAVFSLIWFGQPIYLIIASLIILGPGVVLFIRFLHNYPIPPSETRYD